MSPDCGRGTGADSGFRSPSASGCYGFKPRGRSPTGSRSPASLQTACLHAKASLGLSLPRPSSPSVSKGRHQPSQHKAGTGPSGEGESPSLLDSLGRGKLSGTKAACFVYISFAFSPFPSLPPAPLSGYLLQQTGEGVLNNSPPPSASYPVGNLC